MSIFFMFFYVELFNGKNLECHDEERRKMIIRSKSAKVNDIITL